ncbi:Ornithine carbamoyltransferase [invertebrate metagenome]|uniref:Ornithine carbamoyltransferase n=1 Tax=invertebrate metagenome TaxID=1711999 RepID=A0A2H9T8V0_9ZZZZ
MNSLNDIIQQISALDTQLHTKDLLLTWEHSTDELKQILKVAEGLRTLRNENISTKVFDSGLGVSLFRDNSTRTRFSFAAACNMLGLTVQELDERKSQMAHGETVRETANMISFCAEAIGIRDDMYLGYGNQYMREVGKAMDFGKENGVLAQRPAMVNLQCDLDHPTQSMTDMAWLIERFGSLENLRGKKIAMTWAYSPCYGKPLSVPQGTIGLMTRFGMDVTLAHPEGYDLVPDVIETAGRQAVESGGKFNQVNTMEEAFENADIVYPKSWAPYYAMGRRTELLKAGDQAGLNKLEQECLTQNTQYKKWHCTEEMMKLTRNGEALYMHCLPADITGVSCKEGEVTESVFNKYLVDTYKQAGWKPFIIASMILNRRFANPDIVLENLIKKGKRRINA